MVPATVTGTLAGIPAARFGSGRVLLAANILRTVGALGCAVGVGIGAPTAIVFLAAAVVASAGLLVRPVQSALLPSLARLPEELVAGNVVSSLGEAVGTFIGPLLGGILVAAVSEAAAMSVASGLFVLAAISVARLDAVEDRGAEVPSDQATIGQPSFLRSVRTVARRPGPALVLLGFLSQVLVRGMLITLIVVASIELLGLGRAGIGWLNAAIGLGGLIGAIGAASLGRGIRLSRVFSLSLAMWGLPIAVMGAWPVPLVALGAMVVTGLSNASLDISGFTVLQRSFPPRERFAAFGLLEGAGGFGLAVGGIIASIVLDRVGIRGALALAGALLPIHGCRDLAADQPTGARIAGSGSAAGPRPPGAAVRAAQPVHARAAGQHHGPDRRCLGRRAHARGRRWRPIPGHRDGLGRGLVRGPAAADVRTRRGHRRDRLAP